MEKRETVYKQRIHNFVHCWKVCPISDNVVPCLGGLNMSFVLVSDYLYSLEQPG